MRRAYLIGNAEYENPYWKSLSNPINDINILNKALNNCGFKVELFENAKRYDMNSFVQLESTIDPSDVILFYYSGHGFEEDGDSYLVPVDATEMTDTSFKITDLLEFIGNKQGVKCIFVFDCCRNLFCSGNALGKKPIQKIRTKEGAFICFSTTLGNTALDTSGIFAKKFSEKILIDKLCIEQVFKRIRNDVIGETVEVKGIYNPGEYQVTCDYSTLVDEFYFVNSDIEKLVKSCASKIKDDDTLIDTKKIIEEFYYSDMNELMGSIDFNTFKTNAILYKMEDE